MDMALAQARTGNADELRIPAQVFDRGRTGVAHGRLDAADKLVDHILGRSLERDLTFDPLGHQLHLVLDVTLEITIGRTAAHRPDRTHATVRLVGTALIKERLARRFSGTCQHRADHHGRCACGQCLGGIARCAQAAIADYRNARLLGFLGSFHDRGELRHANARHNARGTDRTRTDAHLHAVRTRIDQRARCFRRRHVACNHLCRVGEPLHSLDRTRNVGIVAMRSIDHDDIAFSVDQCLSAGKALVTHGRGRGHAQAARAVLGGIGVSDRLLDVLDGDKPHAAEGIVHYQQLFDPAGMKQAPRLILADAGGDSRQVLMRHQFAHGLRGIVGKAHVAIGEDADQLARSFYHRDTADLVQLHQRLRIAQRGIRRDGDGIDHHAAFEALDLTHRRALFLDGEIAVQHADAAELGHDDRHVGLCHGVHRGGNDRNVQPDIARQPGAGIGLGRNNVGLRGTQQYVVKSQSELDIHVRHRKPRGRFVAAHVIKWGQKG